MKIDIQKKRYCDGFMLLDALFAVLLISVAIVSLLVASQSVTKINAKGVDISTANYLSQQLRECFATLAAVDPQTSTLVFGPEEDSLELYDDIDDFDGKTFSPPIDIERKELSDFSDYTQRVFVENVSTTDPDTVVEDHSSNLIRVRVEILKDGEVLTKTSWLRSR